MIVNCIILSSILFPILAQPKCGQTPILPNLNSGRIAGGSAAVPYSWPWQVVYCSKSWFGCDLKCGGTVIGSHWILTAGDCVNGDHPGDQRVIAGVYNQWNLFELGETVYEIKNLYLHPKYFDNSYDIGLIETISEIKFNNHVQPVCLPSHDTATVVEPNTAWALGWGSTEIDGDIVGDLRQVNLPFVNYSTCVKENFGQVDEMLMICAGKTGKGVCKEDTGGPLLVQNKNGSWFQYGITALFGMSCGQEERPGIYARVSALCDFVSSTTNGTVNCQNPDTY